VDVKRGPAKARSTHDGIVRTSRRLENQSSKLARPIIIPVRQNINVNAEFFAVGTTNVLSIINNAATDDQMVIMFMIDGSPAELN
jgi:hypothetical protein